MNRGKIFTRFILCCLAVMLLMVMGCSVKDETATYTISGAVTVYGTGDALANVTITLAGAAAGSTATDTDGNFSFSGAANGTYTLTPSLSNYTFNPVSTVVAVSGANISDTNFVATSTGGATTYSISGTVTGEVQSDVKVTLSGGGVTGTVMTGSDGTYTFANLVDGYSYIVTPSRTGYVFTPEYATVTLSGSDVTGNDFISSL
jgi:hypothetical protein